MIVAIKLCQSLELWVVHQFEKCQAELVEAGVELHITRLRQAQADNNFIETFQTDTLPNFGKVF